MLHEFLSERREELIERCRIKVSQRSAPKVTQMELEHGIPMFLDQLTKTLRVEQTAEPMKSRKVSGPSGGGEPTLSRLERPRHGMEANSCNRDSPWSRSCTTTEISAKPLRISLLN